MGTIMYETALNVMGVLFFGHMAYSWRHEYRAARMDWQACKAYADAQFGSSAYVVHQQEPTLDEHARSYIIYTRTLTWFREPSYQWYRISQVNENWTHEPIQRT